MYGNLNGGVGQRRVVVGASDFYKHVPREMTEATKIGVIMSLLSLLLMMILFVCETWAFARTDVVSNVVIDANVEQTIALNFNVTLYDLHCDFVSVDVWDTLGTNLQNITKDIIKYHLDDRGNIRKFAGRNTRQRAIQHEHHHEAVHQYLSETEAHAVSLDETGLKDFLERYGGRAIVDFYAPWCIWCQRLEPTWELFARKVGQDPSIRVGVGKVDCVAHAQLCKDERILAFPTLRWYSEGKGVMPDYRGDRTVDSLVEYVKRRAGDEKEVVEERKAKGEERERDEYDEDHHPGCMVAGRIMVNRVPGNFHIQAESIHHELHSAMTNLTHRVNHLSFGPKDGPPGHLLHNIPTFYAIPEKYRRYINPLKDRFYPTYAFHQAFHHHMKIISTHIDSLGPSLLTRSNKVIYQILEQSQLVLYDPTNVPEIRFSFDLSPMSVIVTKEGRRWYEYMTSLCAIIGGTYTTLGLINATLLRIFKPKKL